MRCCEYEGLSGVSRKPLGYSGIHKHLLKGSMSAAELDKIRDNSRTEDQDCTPLRRAHREEKTEVFVRNASLCTEETLRGALAALLFPRFNQGETLKTSLAPVNLCED